MIMHTFFESYDWNGKTVIPFNTHEGSGSSGTYDDIKSIIPSATVKDGLAIAGHIARTDESHSEIDNWLNKLGF